MFKLLKKELVLSAHPTTFIMLLLSCMVLIPNYPYSVVFFYITLSLFFTCIQGRENNDIIYSLNLPIAKRDIVKARMMFAVILELVQIALTIPFAILSQKINTAGNSAGIEPNLVYFGIGFILYGLFNFIFFSRYYRDINRIGISFVITSIVIFFLISAEVVLTYAVPFVRDYLDTKDPAYLSYKLIILVISILFYGIITYLTYLRAVKEFEKIDL